MALSIALSIYCDPTHPSGFALAIFLSFYSVPFHRSSSAALKHVPSEDTVLAVGYAQFDCSSSLHIHPFNLPPALCSPHPHHIFILPPFIKHSAPFYASSCLYSIAPPFLLLPYPTGTFAPLFPFPSPDSKLFSSSGLPIQAP